MNRLFIAVFTSLSLLASARGAVNITEQVGTGHAWVADNAWQSVMGLNDSFNSLGATDFVGNVSNPGFYMASTNDYLYFRMRVAYTGVATLATFRETHMVLLNVVGYNYTTGISGTNDGTLPDFALAQDSKSADNTKHGLEMCVLSAAANSWGGIKMTDIDGIFSSKLSTTGIQDINGAGNTTEGYVRTVDSVPTVNEALTLNLSDNTTFIDFAVSWAYLEYAWNALGNTSLFKDQQWQIALGSIAAANDHGFISTDIGAGADTTSLPSAGFVAIPEPNIAQILQIAGVLALLTRHRRLRQ